VNHDLRNRRLVGMGIWAFVVATVFLGCSAARVESGQQASPTEAAPSGDAENGKAIFKKDGCYECHGYGGQGGVTGARLSANPISFAAFVQYVRAPKNQMPPYTAKVISDKELADIYAFLHSLPKPPDVKSIPILNE